MQTIFVKPFLDILKVEDTTKQCVATRARKLSTKAPKRYKENFDHKSKVNFKNSHPIASNPIFKGNKVRNENPLEANIAE